MVFRLEIVGLNRPLAPDVPTFARRWKAVVDDVISGSHGSTLAQLLFRAGEPYHVAMQVTRARPNEPTADRAVPVRTW